MKWSRVTVRTTPEAAEGVLDVMCALAGGAVQSAGDAGGAIHAYAPAARARVLMERIRARLNALRQAGLPTRGSRVTSRPIADKRWERSWQRGFRAQRLAPGLVVAPPWERCEPRPGETVVIIQPGLAFGTGQHATTRMCLQALRRYLRKGDAVADVGAGSGILAIAAVKMGAGLALGIDNDPLALRAAADNARRNRVGNRVLVRRGDLLRGVRRKFHLILANLTAEQLIELAPGAAGRLRPGGVFVGSGIAAGNVAPTARELEAAGLQQVAVRRRGEWRTVVFRKPDSGSP